MPTSISENGSAPGDDRHVPLAGACLAGLAAAAMKVSSLSVIANALRLRRLDLASGDTEPGDPPAA